MMQLVLNSPNILLGTVTTVFKYIRTAVRDSSLFSLISDRRVINPKTNQNI